MFDCFLTGNLKQIKCYKIRPFRQSLLKLHCDSTHFLFLFGPFQVCGRNHSWFARACRFCQGNIKKKAEFLLWFLRYAYLVLPFICMSVGVASRAVRITA